jgi:hypothetical protein
VKQSGKRRKFIPSLIGVGVALAAPLMVAAPASAATSDCASGKTCIWRDSTYVTNGSGSSLVAFAGYIPDYST